MTDFFGNEGDPTAPIEVSAAAETEQMRRQREANEAAAAKQKQDNFNYGYVGGKTESGGQTGAAIAEGRDPLAGREGYGATAGYAISGDDVKAGYDYMHDLGSPDAFGTTEDLFNAAGEQMGISHAGAPVASGWGGTEVTSPLGFNPLASVADTQTGPAIAGQNTPVAAIAPEASQLVGETTIGDGVAGAVGQAISGGAGPNFDTSGADRGGMRADTGAALTRTRNAADAARALGSDVLAGTTAPGGAGATQQQDVLDQVLGFAKGPEGPSKAQLLLDQASQGNMADVLAAARSGRARDAGSQARAMNVAQGELAGLGVDAARNAALLRQQEAQDFRNQQLAALGLGGDVSGAIRGAGIQERGQTLDFVQGQQQIGAGLEGDVLGAIPQIEQIRHEDEFELTPEQKLAAAAMGKEDPSTLDYVLDLAGDVLPFAGGLLDDDSRNYKGG